MTEREHLLTCLAEEAVEVAQRATKALRFGLDEIQPGQPFTNAQRIRLEYADLIGIYDLCMSKGLLTHPDSRMIEAKTERFSKYLEYSRQCGTVSEK